MPKRTCRMNGCERTTYAHGWCRYHYDLEYRAGRVVPATDAERFWAKFVRAEDGCWNWTGHVSGQGYGRFRWQGSTVGAHRAAYELLVEPIPDGLTIDHLCFNTRCVNPSHLEPVTNAVNLGRSRKATKTHCVHGHEFTPENTSRQTNGTRKCRTCSAERQRRRYWERKARR